MEKPTLEEVKEYFKDAKEITCNDGFLANLCLLKDTRIREWNSGYYIRRNDQANIYLWESNNGYSEITEYKDINDIPVTHEEIKPDHYDNTICSLYKIAEERKWSPYLFDIVKRLELSGKKGEFKTDLEKSKFVIDLWLEESNKNLKTE